MTFCSNEQNEREIIRKVQRVNKNNYTIHYLDGSESNFVNNDEEYLKKLEEKSISQAKERDEKTYITTNINKWGCLIVSLASINLTSQCQQKNLLTLACIGFILSIKLIKDYIKNSKKIKELKKYRILLENYEEFKNNPNVSKLVKADALYRDPVDIFSIDDYSLYDMKLMIKELKK